MTHITPERMDELWQQAFDDTHEGGTISHRFAALLFAEPAPAQPVAWYEWTGAIKPTKSLDSDRPLVFGDTPPAAQPAPVQDSTCNETLRAQGKAYPRTCRKCGFGPCIGAKLKEKNNG
jgi:hypothetical protein